MGTRQSRKPQAIFLHLCARASKGDCKTHNMQDVAMENAKERSRPQAEERSSTEEALSCHPPLCCFHDQLTHA